MEQIPWKLIIGGAAVVGVALVMRGRTAPTGESMVPWSVICADCGHIGETLVGNTPTLEPWPRDCQDCGKTGVYLAGRCLHCGKYVPRKEPGADTFGVPDQCPWCKMEYAEQ